MNDSAYWWMAIWPDGSITKGHCATLPKAIRKTDRCVACSIQTSKEAVASMLPMLRKRYKDWGAQPWQVTDTSAMHYSQAKKGFQRKDYKSSKQRVKKKSRAT